VIVCDTGPLVAAALSRDPDHRRCVDLFTGLHLANRQMVLPAPVVAEVTGSGSRWGNSETQSPYIDHGDNWSASPGTIPDTVSRWAANCRSVVAMPCIRARLHRPAGRS
jgi:hypothetical protein